MINVMLPVDETLFVLRSRGGIDTFDGQVVSTCGDGLPPPTPPSNDNWGARDLVRAWGGRPCICTEHGVYVYRERWERVAEGTPTHGVAFDPRDGTLWAVAGSTIALVREEGDVERLDVAIDDLRRVEHHQGAFYGYGPRAGIHLLTDDEGRPRESRKLADPEPAPKGTRYLISSPHGLLFVGRERVLRLREGGDGFECLWDPATTPLAW